MKVSPTLFQKFSALQGMAALAIPLTGPAAAQNRSSTPYCFAVKDTLSVFARPANNAATSDRFNRGDIACATTNPPTTRVDGNRAFVEVAIYGGNKAWVPQRSTIDGAPILMDCLLINAQAHRPMRREDGGRPEF